MSVNTTIIRYIWSLPCTIVGLCLACPTLLLGGSIRIVKGIIEVSISLHGKPNVFLRHFPFNAITFGHVVIARSEADMHALRAHELAHVRQYEKWGILFFVAYVASSLWEFTRSRRPYWDNWFEVQARANEIKDVSDISHKSFN